MLVCVVLYCFLSAFPVTVDVVAYWFDFFQGKDTLIWVRFSRSKIPKKVFLS